LWDTHEPFYKKIREKNPGIPVIFVTKPNTSETDPEDNDRRRAVRTTYENAMARDEKVYYVDGLTLFGTTERDLCTTDGGHPNDLGFFRMAEAIYPVLKEALLIS